MSDPKEIQKEDIELNLVEGGNFISPDTEQDPGQDTLSLHKSSEVAHSVPKFIGGKYRVIQLLGKGGMGAVYKVHHLALDKTFAAKVLNKDVTTDFKTLQRFDQEAKSVGTLNHPNLIAVHDYGTSDDGTPYLIMDYLEGHSLDEELKENGPLAEKRTLKIFSLVCDALKHAHEKGIIHRDIKPSNIMLVKTEDGNESAKLVDFGIAKRELVDNKVTQTGEVFGTPLYMSPEQCLGKPCDSRSDVYSVGCVMYEALTGIAPFAADNAVQTIFNHLNEKPAPLRKASPNSKLSAAIEQLVAVCLEKDPNDRIGSAENIGRNLRRIESGQSPRLDTKLVKVKKETAFRYGNAIAQLLALLFLFIIGYFVYLHYTNLTWAKFATEGVEEFEEREYSKAAVTFEKGLINARAAHAQDFDQIRFLEYLTTCYSKLHDYKKVYASAKPVAEFYAKQNKFKAADPYANTTWKYAKSVNREKVLESLNFAIPVREKALGSNSPLLVEQLIGRSSIFRQTGESEKAIQDAERGIKLATENPAKVDLSSRFALYEILTDCLTKTGENKRALTVLNTALSTPKAPADMLKILKIRRDELQRKSVKSL